MGDPKQMKSPKTEHKWRPYKLGAYTGFIVASVTAPSMIAWYFNPPVAMGVTCTAPIEWALGKLQLAQFLGIIGGGICGWLFKRWLKK